jgi:hypothetical protein
MPFSDSILNPELFLSPRPLAIDKTVHPLTSKIAWIALSCDIKYPLFYFGLLCECTAFVSMLRISREIERAHMLLLGRKVRCGIIDNVLQY